MGVYEHIHYLTSIFNSDFRLYCAITDNDKLNWGVNERHMYGSMDKLSNLRELWEQASKHTNNSWRKC